MKYKKSLEEKDSEIKNLKKKLIEDEKINKANLKEIDRLTDLLK